MSQSRSLKVLLVGDHGTGKTSFVQRICRDQFSADYRQTVGVDFWEYRLPVLESSENRHGLNCVHLQLWDVSGDQSGERAAAMLCEGADAILIFYDITSAGTYREARDWLTRITSLSPETTQFDGLIFVVGTKSDMAHLRAVRTEEHDRISKDSAVAAGFILSAKTREGLVSPLIHLTAARLGLDPAQLQAGDTLQQNSTKVMVLPAAVVSDPQSAHSPRSSLDRGKPSAKCILQ